MEKVQKLAAAMPQLGSGEVNLALLTISSLIILLGLFSKFKQRVFLSDPIVALLVGFGLGPSILGWIKLSDWGEPEVILEQGARLTLAIQLMGVALRLPRGYPFQQWRSLGLLLGIVMPLMWLSSSLFIYLILGLPFWVAMLVGAIVTPTDPVVSTFIVTGKVAQQNIPSRIRSIISAESGANDGLAYPFVFLPLLILTRSPQDALLHWVTKTLLWEVGAAVALGTLLGYGAGKLLMWAEANQTTENRSFFSFTVAFSVLVLGAVKLLGSDGVLAVFVAGVVLNQVVGGQNRINQEYDVQEAIELLFTLYIFLLLGLALPWREWLALGWNGLLLVVAILLLRRLPALLLLRRFINPLQSPQDALFMGWFGPIGVAALFYAIVSMRQTGVETAWVVTSLLICASVLAHGLSAVPLSKLYGRYCQARNAKSKSYSTGLNG